MIERIIIAMVQVLVLLGASTAQGQYSLPNYTGLVPDQCGSWNNGANYITGNETFIPDPNWDGSGCLWFPIYNYAYGSISVSVHAPDARIKYITGQEPYSCAGLPTCMPDESWSLEDLQIAELNEPGKVHFIVVHFESYVPNVSRITFGFSSGPTGNIRIGIAYAFCNDISQSINSTATEFSFDCRYYRFYVPELEQVRIDLDGDIDMVNVYGPLPTIHPEQWYGLHGACQIGEGALSLSGPEFVLDEELEQGYYYVQVRSTNPQGTVYINVEEGLACPEIPANQDCAEAVPFCDDLTVEMDPTWALENTKCLWYTFTTAQQGPVAFNVTSPGSRIRLYGPLPPGAACADYLRELCGSPGYIMEGTASMVFNSDLPAGTYFINVEVDINTPGPIQFDVVHGIECLPCDNCIPGFQLTPGERYVVSAWASVPGTPSSTYTYTTPLVVVEAPLGNSLGTFSPSGSIIDGWQRIEGEFTMPVTGSFRLQLKVTSGTAYFDDVRIFPADGSVKCYVYDPTTLKFVAELDERHYATFYEYDGEGKLTRIKKETERGIMTIQETRYNNSDRSQQ